MVARFARNCYVRPQLNAGVSRTGAMPTVLSKRELRERSLQLRALLCEWDPIGVMSDPEWPRDEYECLEGPLLTLLAQDAPEEDIARYLRNEIAEHFGLSSANHDFTDVSGRLRRWFDHGWRKVGEPVTIFVGLLEEGVEVWRPVQARPLDDGHFRIIGVEADVRDETWQFPVGAIVRCVRKKFADGTSGMAAVEQVEQAG